MESPDEQLNPYASPKSEVFAPDGEKGEAPELAPGEVIRAEGVVSPRDLFHANGLTYRPVPSDAIGCLLLLVVMLVPWAVMLSTFAGPSAAVGTALLGLALAVWPVVNSLRQLRRLDRYWWHRRGICQPQRIEISTEEIRHQTEASVAVYGWSAFSKYTCSARVMLLHFDPPNAFHYDPPQSFLLIPRTFFAGAAQWDLFVRLVQQKLPNRYHENRRR